MAICYSRCRLSWVDFHVRLWLRRRGIWARLWNVRKGYRNLVSMIREMRNNQLILVMTMFITNRTVIWLRIVVAIRIRIRLFVIGSWRNIRSISRTLMGNRLLKYRNTGMRETDGLTNFDIEYERLSNFSILFCISVYFA